MADVTISAFATIADVRDGTAGVSILVSNENHTFVADAAGAVSATELAAYYTDIDVLVSNSAYAFIASGALAANQWKISDGTNDGAAAITVAGDLTATVTDRGDDARIAIADGNTDTDGFVDGGASSPDSLQFVVPIQVMIGSTVLQFNRILTFSKAKGGSAMVLTLTVDAVVLEYDKTGTLKTPNENIVFDAELENIAATAGNVTWEYRLRPTDTWTAVPSTAGYVRSETQQTRLSVTRTALAALLTGGATSVSVRTSLSNRLDIVTIARVQDGADGADGADGNAAVELRITPRTSNVLLNNTGSVIFDARLYYKGALATAAISAYQWFNVAADGTINPITNANGSFQSFNALAMGSGARLIGCRVTYDDENAAVDG